MPIEGPRRATTQVAHVFTTRVTWQRRQVTGQTGQPEGVAYPTTAKLDRRP